MGTEEQGITPADAGVKTEGQAPTVAELEQRVAGLASESQDPQAPNREKKATGEDPFSRYVDRLDGAEADAEELDAKMDGILDRAKVWGEANLKPGQEYNRYKVASETEDGKPVELVVHHYKGLGSDIALFEEDNFRGEVSISDSAYDGGQKSVEFRGSDGEKTKFGRRYTTGSEKFDRILASHPGLKSFKGLTSPVSEAEKYVELLEKGKVTHERDGHKGWKEVAPKTPEPPLAETPKAA